MGYCASLRAEHEPLWQAICEHPFVQGLGRGDLDRERHRRYLTQDYLYVRDFARVLAVAAARAGDVAQARSFTSLAQLTLDLELALLRESCAELGVTDEELAMAEPAMVTAAYAGCLLRTAYEGTVLDVVASLLPCAVGYVEIATRLATAGLPDNRLCREWIEAYTSPEYAEVTDWLRGLLDGAAGEVSASARERWRRLYHQSSRFELAFFEMGWSGDTWPGAAVLPSRRNP